MSGPKKCAACGHTAADHDEGRIGASVYTKATGDQPFCHVDDHSCYSAVLLERAMTFGGPNDQVAVCRRCGKTR